MIDSDLVNEIYLFMLIKDLNVFYNMRPFQGRIAIATDAKNIRCLRHRCYFGSIRFSINSPSANFNFRKNVGEMNPEGIPCL